MTSPSNLGDELLDLIPDLVATAPGFDAVLERLPATGQSLVVGGCEGSLAAGLVAALTREHPQRVFVVVAHDPAMAVSAERERGRIVSIGRYVLRGVQGPQELFTLVAPEHAAV